MTTTGPRSTATTAAATVNDSPAGAITARAWQTLFITSVAMFLVSMDVTIVSVALPAISRSFHASPATLSWVFTAYNITFAALLLLAGKLADRVGRKRVFLGGLVFFAAASLLAAIAPSESLLIGARTLQALGSALIYPASLALLLPEFPVSRRSMAIGVWGGIAGFGGALAPTLGALLVEWAGWRAVFFINIPFVAAALVAGVIVLREAKGENPTERFDPVAVPMAAVAVGVLVLAVVQGATWGWTDPRIVGSFVLAAALVPLFLRRSARHPRPLLDLELFRFRSFAAGNLAQGLYVGACFGWLILMPSFFVNVWHWSPLAAGFGVAPTGTISALLSPIAGRLADRVGHRELVTVGVLIGTPGLVWWAVMVDSHPHYLTAILPGMVLLGLGTTAGFATLTGAIMSRVPPRFYSMAGAARSTLFQLFSAIGIAAAIALFDAAATSGGDSVAPYRRVWWLAAGLSLAAVLVAAVGLPAWRAGDHRPADDGAVP